MFFSRRVNYSEPAEPRKLLRLRKARPAKAGGSVAKPERDCPQSQQLTNCEPHPDYSEPLEPRTLLRLGTGALRSGVGALEPGDEVGQVLSGHALFKAFGHERKLGGANFLEVAAQDGLDRAAALDDGQA